MTETGAIAFSDPQDREAGDSVGRPLPGITLRILDDAGQPLPEDRSGESAVAEKKAPDGTPLLEVVDNGTLEIYLLVPSNWLSRLQPGQTFDFTPDETGKPLKAKVKRLGARIDEGSQTLLLIGNLSDDAKGLLAGMSGTAQFQVTE